ncbi:MAG: hypothetical protein ACI8PZ_005686 [Myxococcota bacterium]|jgi:hypothetical protein
MLTIAQIRGLVTAAVNANLDRDALFVGIDPLYKGAFAVLNAVLPQHLSDLNKLSSDGPILDGSFPLRTWLENAQFLTMSLPVSHVFADVLLQLSGRMADQAPPAAMLPESNEAVFFVDQRVGVAFFAGGVRTAKSVVRFVVPVFDGGARVVDNRGNPATSYGTGWVVGAGGLVMTNAHVVRARIDNTLVVTPADQDLQRAAMSVEFDFEDGKATTPAAVAEILHLDIALDYAIVRLAPGHPDRPALPLQQQRIVLAPRPGGGGPNDLEYVPVNIVQHPNGEAKQAAFRDNVVTHSTDAELRYFTDTKRGSSGAPVCNDRWQVVALHRASSGVAKVVSFNGRQSASTNLGTQISAILADLRGTPLWAMIEPALAFA